MFKLPSMLPVLDFLNPNKAFNSPAPEEHPRLAAPRISHVDRAYEGMLGLITRMQERELTLEKEIADREKELSEVRDVLRALNVAREELEPVTKVTV